MLVKAGHYARDCCRSRGTASVNQVAESATSAATSLGPSASQLGVAGSPQSIKRIEFDLSELSYKSRFAPGSSSSGSVSAVIPDGSVTDAAACEFFEMCCTDQDDSGMCLILIAVLRWILELCDYQGVDIILDSGADHSCLPMSFAHVGARGSPARAQFRDAQGKVIDARETRVATMEVDGISFKEHWLVAPVTAPLLRLGKLLRTGWSVSPAANQKLSLVKDDVCIPIFLKHNSLCVTADIRMLAVNDDCSNL